MLARTVFLSSDLRPSLFRVETADQRSPVGLSAATTSRGLSPSAVRADRHPTACVALRLQGGSDLLRRGDGPPLARPEEGRLGHLASDCTAADVAHALLHEASARLRCAVGKVHTRLPAAEVG